MHGWLWLLWPENWNCAPDRGLTCPFRAEIILSFWRPGRCPGLRYAALSGRKGVFQLRASDGRPRWGHVFQSSFVFYQHLTPLGSCFSIIVRFLPIFDPAGVVFFQSSFVFYQHLTPLGSVCRWWLVVIMQTFGIALRKRV